MPKKGIMCTVRIGATWDGIKADPIYASDVTLAGALKSAIERAGPRNPDYLKRQRIEKLIAELETLEAQ